MLKQSAFIFMLFVIVLLLFKISNAYYICGTEKVFRYENGPVYMLSFMHKGRYENAIFYSSNEMREYVKYIDFIGLVYNEKRAFIILGEDL